MQNLNLVLLSGGYHECSPAWNEDPLGKGNYYKLYFPVAGNARVFVENEWYEFIAGNVYFINGFLLDKQRCDTFMNVYWLHFIPESQFLSMCFNNLKPVYCWEKGDPVLASIEFEKIPFLFDASYSIDSNLIEKPSLALSCNMNAIILLLVSNMIMNQSSESQDVSYPLYIKLNPALEYINLHYKTDLKLEEISRKSFLNPIYFSRLFKKCFKMTPAQYIIMIRLNEACRLLTQTDMSILEISENIGFCNQFYFSKVFKHHFRKTPSGYRITKFSP